MKKIIISILIFGFPCFYVKAQDTVNRDNFPFRDCTERNVFPNINLDGTETRYDISAGRDTVILNGKQTVWLRNKVILLDSALNTIDSVLLPHYRYPEMDSIFYGTGRGILLNTYKVGDCFYCASVYCKDPRRELNQEYDGLKIDSIAFETFNKVTGTHTCVSHPLNTPDARFNRYLHHFHMGGDKFGAILSHARPVGRYYPQPWQYLGDSSRFIVYQISRGIIKDTTLPIPCTYVDIVNSATPVRDKIAFFALSGTDALSGPKGDLFLIDTSDFSFQRIYSGFENNHFQVPFVDALGYPLHHLDLQQVNDSTIVSVSTTLMGGLSTDYVTPFIFSLPDWKLKHVVKIPISKGDTRQYHLFQYEKAFGVHGDTVIYAFGHMAADQIRLHFQGTQEVRVVSFSASTGELFSDVFLELPRGIKTVADNVMSTQDGGASFTVLNNIGNRFECYLVKYNPLYGVSLREVSTGETVQLHVYPNPAKDFVTVDIHGHLAGKAIFEIHDMQGRKAFSQELSQPLGNKVDVSSLPPGVYSCKLYFNDKAIGQKIIIGQ